MSEPHSTQQFTRGDDWPIEGNAHWHDWSAMSLDGATIEWELQNSAGEVVATMADASLEIVDSAAGKFRFVLGRTKTVTLPPGSYRDQCRITNGIVRSTQWHGVIECVESFFEEPLTPPS